MDWMCEEVPRKVEKIILQASFLLFPEFLKLSTVQVLAKFCDFGSLVWRKLSSAKKQQTESCSQMKLSQDGP